MIDARLKSLRLARGLSLDSLATRMGGLVTKQTLSNYERGIARPSALVLNKLAEALDVKSSDLWGEPTVRIEFIEFRKKSAFGKKEEAQLKSALNLELEQRTRIQLLIAPGARPDLPLEKYPIRTQQDAEEAANHLREQWKLGTDPIANLTDVLESHLLHVVECEAPAAFDGLSARIYESSSNMLVGAAVVSRCGIGGERQRLNLAHELGHVVEAPEEGVDVERAAFRFAGAFLAPADILFSEVGRKRTSISVQELKMLRRKLGISLQAIVHRLHDLEIINDFHYKYWWQFFNRVGWRKQEPDESLPERSDWLKRNVLRAYSEGLLPREDAVRILGSDEGLDEPSSIEARRAFARLPLAEKRRIMEEQAEKLAQHYVETSEDREDFQSGDFIEY